MDLQPDNKSGDEHVRIVSARRATNLARQFKRSPTEKVAAVLDALESLGLVEQREGSYQLLG